MIVRTWHGMTALADGDAYEEFMIKRAAPDYGSVPGLIRTVFSRRDVGDIAHFLLITFWQDIEAVKHFAGSNPAVAKYYPEDDDYLLEKEAESLNHHVFWESATDGS